jgi:co-chaperonin GroES (HSP10)
MAKSVLMGDGKLSEEERHNLKQVTEDQEKQMKDLHEREQQKEQEKKKVTLEELLATTLDPMEDRIIIYRDPVDSVTPGGIIKPEEVVARERPSRGTVLRVGPGKAVTDTEINNYIQLHILKAMEVVHQQDFNSKKVVGDIQTIRRPPYKPGERILFGKFAGTPVDDPATGEELLIMRPHDIFCKL